VRTIAKVRPIARSLFIRFHLLSIENEGKTAYPTVSGLEKGSKHTSVMEEKGANRSWIKPLGKEYSLIGTT
jgi:hypothetical protein